MVIMINSNIVPWRLVIYRPPKFSIPWNTSEIYHVCVQTHIRTHTNTHTHTLMHTNMHTHMYMCTHTYTDTHTHKHTHVSYTHLLAVDPLLQTHALMQPILHPQIHQLLSHTHTQMHKVTPLPFFPLTPPTYVHPIFLLSPFSLPFGQTADIQLDVSGCWPSSVQCSPAKPDYSIPCYSDPYWTIQPHTTGMPKGTHTINTCQVHTTYIHTHVHMQTHTHTHIQHTACPSSRFCGKSFNKQGITMHITHVGHVKMN